MATPNEDNLKVGDNVLAYNPTTGQSDTEPVQHVWINHDHDLVDVGLQETTASVPTASGTGVILTGPHGAGCGRGGGSGAGRHAR